MKHPFAVLIAVALLSACSWKPQVWTDEKSGTTMIAQKLPSSKDAAGVRDASAGFIEGLVQDRLVLPDSAGSVTIHGFPGIYVRGSGRDEKAGLRITAAIVFGEAGNYLIQCIGEADVDFAEAEAHIVFDGHPSDVARPVSIEIGKKLADGIGELREILEKGL